MIIRNLGNKMDFFKKKKIKSCRILFLISAVVVPHVAYARILCLEFDNITSLVFNVFIISLPYLRNKLNYEIVFLIIFMYLW